jgi:glycosyltransferase involved in cell wall biosynthesis
MTVKSENSNNPTIGVILPTYNEEPALSTGLVGNYKKQPHVKDVIIVDGNSTDRTRFLAERDGAIVFNFKDRGKGDGIGRLQRIVRQYPEKFDHDFYVMNDADCTCRVEEIETLVSPLMRGKDVVIGVRDEDSKQNSIKSIQKFGRYASEKFANILYLRRDLGDPTTPSWAFNRKFFTDEPDLISVGFDLESELRARAILGGYKVEAVHVSPKARVGVTKFSGLSYLKVPTWLFKHRVIGSIRYSK